MQLVRTALLLFVLAALCAGAGNAPAQEYPMKSIRLIVPYPPGGANDNLARPLVQKLTESLGVQVILENRGGGGALIGADIVAKAQPDGYTILFCSTATHATSPQLISRVPYDPFKDFEPVVLLATSPVLAAASNASNITTIKDLVTAAKRIPAISSTARAGSAPFRIWRSRFSSRWRASISCTCRTRAAATFRPT